MNQTTYQGNEVKNQRLPVKDKNGKLKENYVILTKVDDMCCQKLYKAVSFFRNL